MLMSENELEGMQKEAIATNSDTASRNVLKSPVENYNSPQL